MKRCKRNGQTLVEIMVAIVFLAAGGMALYTAAARTVGEAAWGAERVLCEGLLNDMIEFYSTCTYYDFSTATSGIRGVVKLDAEVPLDQLLKKDDADAFAFFEKSVVMHPFQPPKPGDPPDSYYPTITESNPNPPADPVVKANEDEIFKEWEETRKAKEIKRIAFFYPKSSTSGGTDCGILTCVVRRKSASLGGGEIALHRQIVVYKYNN